MPRRWQSGTANVIFHVMNRAARRQQVFFHPYDYLAFQHLMVLAGERFDMRLLSYALMPNHWHLVLWPRADPDLSGYMQWLTANHVRAWHLAHDSVGTGTLYQGRFKAIPVQNDIHFLTVCSYVERNPVRAALVPSATLWEWSSAWAGSSTTGRPEIAPWPVPRPSGWKGLLDDSSALPVKELRDRIRRGAPYGETEWAATIANQLHLPARLLWARSATETRIAETAITPELPELPEH